MQAGATRAPMQRGAVRLRRLELQIAGLAYARTAREEAGAGGEELVRYSAEIARRRRLRAALAQCRFTSRSQQVLRSSAFDGVK